ncbi:MAG: 2-C-methyl-D-erythritol 2,4-cyclodiphosphate synthase [Oscillospiraceae bacterium]
MYKNKKVYAVIVAGGSGTRIGFDKMLYVIDGKAVVERSVAAFSENSYVDEIVVVAGENIARVTALCHGYGKVVSVVRGGTTRAQSVLKGIGQLKGSGIVAIHDGARPFVSERVICEAVEAAALCGAAVPCVRVKDTIKRGQEDFVLGSLDRNTLFITQTPQVFDLDKYRTNVQNFFDTDITDDAQLFEKAGAAVKITRGEYENYKITTIDDLKKENIMRIGHGYDVHKLVSGRKLILGGVEIPYEKGLLGHSDADVLLHAVMDSLLGALALGDIGKHFPDTEEEYKGADSLKLLIHVGELLRQNNASVGNIDATILCQSPKLAKHIPAMRENIAKALGTCVQRVSVKATTEEGLGFTGEGLGISAHCVCLLQL